MKPKNISDMKFKAIIFATALLAACSGQTGNNVKFVDADDTESTSGISPEERKKLEIQEITNRMERLTYHSILDFQDENCNEYFSEELIDTYNRACTIASENGDDMYLDWQTWVENQDPDVAHTLGEVMDVYDLTDNTATVDMVITQWKTPVKKTVYLIYEEDSWYVNDYSIQEDGKTLRQFFRETVGVE